MRERETKGEVKKFSETTNSLDFFSEEGDLRSKRFMLLTIWFGGIQATISSGR